MPKVRIDGYEFFFYSNEGTEPPHVHVIIDGREIKFWLSPITLATKNPRVGSHKIRKAQKVVESNESRLMEVWNGFAARK